MRVHDSRDISAENFAAERLNMRNVVGGTFKNFNIGPGARAGKDIPLREVYEQVLPSLSSHQAAGTMAHLSALIAQDALGGTLRMKAIGPSGRLESIDRRHWTTAVPDWEMCFTFTDAGEIDGLTGKNANSRVAGQPDGGCIDLHLNENQALELLQRHGFA